MKKQTTKKCHKCGNTKLIRLTSKNKKICTICNIDIPWYLEPDQKPIH